jgi:hypothetical protein
MGKLKRRPRGSVSSKPFANPNSALPIGTLDGLSRFVDGCGLDSGIEHYVAILRSQGIETCQSCEGGPGHAYLEPTVDFLGGKAEGPRAVAAALAYGLPVSELRRLWHVVDGEIEGPIWSMTFSAKADAHLALQRAKADNYFKRKKTGRIID